MGKVVGSNGYRVSCRHQITAYTIFFGAPIIFCTPNIANNRNVLILLTQGQEINMDIDADPALQISYEQLRLRVVHDPVGQCLVVELLLRLFVLHILGASPDAVAQPVGITVESRRWMSDGVAASLTSLGCLAMLMAARGELEASGRGSLHGHWELWALSLTVEEAMGRLSDRPPAERVQLLKTVVYEWINFFQRTHHSSAEHLPLLFGETSTQQPMIVTKDMLKGCRMDGQEDCQPGYVPQARPRVTSIPSVDLLNKLPPDDMCEPVEPEDSGAPATSSEPAEQGEARPSDNASSGEPASSGVAESNAPATSNELAEQGETRPNENALSGEPASSGEPARPSNVAEAGDTAEPSGASPAPPAATLQRGVACKNAIRGQTLTALPSYRRINASAKVVRAMPKKMRRTGFNPLRKSRGRFKPGQCCTYAGLRAGSTTSQAREYVGTTS